MPSFAIYARLSFRNEDEESIRRQVAQGRAWVVAHKFTPVEYVEPVGHRSARSERQRPKWKELKQDITDGQLSGVWVADIARASRNVRDFLAFLDLCAKRDVALISDKEHIETTNAAGRMLVTVLSAFNQFYSDDLSERQRRRHAFRKAQGETSGRPPMGLKLDRESHRLVPSGETYGDGKTYLDTIKRLCEIYSSGTGCQIAARQLNAEGYRLRSVKGTPRACANTRLTDLLGILETYEPFLPHDLYVRTLLMREQRKGRRENGGLMTHPPSLCRRVLYCARCGLRLSNYHHVRKLKRSNGVRHYDWHGYRHPDSNDCKFSNKLISAEKIDSQVWAWLERLGQVSEAEIERRVELAEQSLEQPDASLELRQRIAALENRLRRIDREWFDGDRGEGNEARSRWKELQAETDKELQVARESLERLTPVPRVRLSREDLRARHRAIAQVLAAGGDAELNNQIVRTLFKRIVLDLPSAQLTFELWPEFESVYGAVSTLDERQ